MLEPETKEISVISGHSKAFSVPDTATEITQATASHAAPCSKSRQRELLTAFPRMYQCK